ncbi:MAG: dTMP kinase [Kangiellaceae bacterium]|nr:dTMP kinase [Kangiellaceae bacterium]
MTNPNSRFISLEGSEGVGKTTSLKFVQSFVEALGHKVLITREPGGTPMAEEIRNILLSEREETVEVDTELLLMFAARTQHVNQVIKPALEQGKWVICDRFVDASYAYQGGGRGIEFFRLQQLEKWCLGDFSPDVTLLLDMSSSEGIERTRKRGKADRFEIEKMSFYEKIRNAYLERAKMEPDRIHIINAAPSTEVVQAEIKSVLEQYL